MYEFNYIKGHALQVQINKETELMKDDRKEQKRLEDLDYIEECKNDRTDEQEAYRDTGMRPSDFN